MSSAGSVISIDEDVGVGVENVAPASNLRTPTIFGENVPEHALCGWLDGYQFDDVGNPSLIPMQVIRAHFEPRISKYIRQQPRANGAQIIDNREMHDGCRAADGSVYFGRDKVLCTESYVGPGVIVTSTYWGAVFLCDFDRKSQSYSVLLTYSPRTETVRMMSFEILARVDTSKETHEVIDDFGHAIRPGDLVSMSRDCLVASGRVREVYKDFVYVHQYKRAHRSRYKRFHKTEVFRAVVGAAPSQYRNVMVPSIKPSARRNYISVSSLIKQLGSRFITRIRSPVLNAWDFIDYFDKLSIIVQVDPDCFQCLSIGQKQTGAFEKCATCYPFTLRFDQSLLIAQTAAKKQVTEGNHVVLTQEITDVPVLQRVKATFRGYVVLETRNGGGGHQYTSMPGSQVLHVADYIESYPPEKQVEVENMLSWQVTHAFAHPAESLNLNSPLLQQKFMPTSIEAGFEMFSALTGEPIFRSRQFARSHNLAIPVKHPCQHTYERGMENKYTVLLTDPPQQSVVFPLKHRGIENQIVTNRGEEDFMRSFPDLPHTGIDLCLKETTAKIPSWFRESLSNLRAPSSLYDVQMPTYAPPVTVHMAAIPLTAYERELNELAVSMKSVLGIK